MELISQHKHQLYKVCRQSQVEELYVFGSILTDTFNKNSDIDMLVSITSSDPIEYAEHYFYLKFELERIFNRKIDLVEEKAIKNELFKAELNNKKNLIYARKNQGLA